VPVPPRDAAWSTRNGSAPRWLYTQAIANATVAHDRERDGEGKRHAGHFDRVCTRELGGRE
jgi:hypothetical protein